VSPTYYFILILIVSALSVYQASPSERSLFLLEVSLVYWLLYAAISVTRSVIGTLFNQPRKRPYKLQSTDNYIVATPSVRNKQETYGLPSMGQQKEWNEMWYVNERQKVILILLAVVLIGLITFPPFHLVVRGSQFGQGFGFILSPPSGSASVDTSLLLLEIVVTTIVCAIGFIISKH